MPDVIILGRGPAGISASLYTARAGLNTLVIGREGGALLKTEAVANYFGFAEPVSGRTLLKNGAVQARAAGAELLDGEAVGISCGNGFSVSTVEKEFSAPIVILATGSQRQAPKIPGLPEFEGHGVSYCAVCDGFFYRGKDVAVLGSGAYALHEAEVLLPLAAKVTVLTNGERPQADFPPQVTVRTEKIQSLDGETVLSGARFADGSFLPLAGIFVAVGVAGSVDLARKLGAETKGAAITVDENRRTSIPGLYAAGDCTGGMFQIAKAVCDGAVAGSAVARSFRSAS